MRSYRQYITEAVVLRSYQHRESDSSVVIWSRELGKLTATAGGVRKINSKLRFGLTPYSLSLITLLYGKGGWRITNSVPIQNLYFSTTGPKNISRVIARVIAFCDKYLDEGLGYEDVFDTVFNGLDYISKNVKTLSECRSAERIIVLRVMYMLGFLDQESFLEPFLSEKVITDQHIFKMQPLLKETTKVINRSLHKSSI